MNELEDARSPHTSPERLTALAQSTLLDVQSAVAQNPSTPTSTLLSLAHRFPAQFLENPVLPLLLLEQPDFAVSIPAPGLIAMLKQPSLPEWLLSAAIQHHSYLVREAAAKSEFLSPEQRKHLAKDTNEGTLLALIENPNTPTELLIEFASIRRSYRIRMAIAKNPRTPEAVLLVLREDRNASVRSCVVLNPRTTIEMLLVFAQETNRDVLCAVAENPKTPPEILETLSTKPNSNIRATIAQNINTPLEILERFASDPNGDIRKALAKNPMTPSNILQQLKQDKNQEIRDAAKQQLQERRQQELAPEEKPADYHPETFLQRNKRSGRRIPN